LKIFIRIIQDNDQVLIMPFLGSWLSAEHSTHG